MKKFLFAAVVFLLCSCSDGNNTGDDRIEKDTTFTPPVDTTITTDSINQNQIK